MMIAFISYYSLLSSRLTVQIIRIIVSVCYCSGMGRLQPLVPQLLHVTVGQAEQPLPPVPTRVGCTAHRKIATTAVYIPLLRLANLSNPVMTGVTMFQLFVQCCEYICIYIAAWCTALQSSVVCMCGEFDFSGRCARKLNGLWMTV